MAQHRGNRTFNELGSKKKEELLREFRNGVTTRSGLSVKKSQYRDEDEQAYDQPQARQGSSWIKMLGVFFLTNLIVFVAYYLVSQLNGSGQATNGQPVGCLSGSGYAHDPLYEKLGQIFLTGDKVDFTAYGAKESDVITASEVMVYAFDGVYPNVAEKTRVGEALTQIFTLSSCPTAQQIRSRYEAVNFGTFSEWDEVSFRVRETMDAANSATASTTDNNNNQQAAAHRSNEDM